MPGLAIVRVHAQQGGRFLPRRDGVEWAGDAIRAAALRLTRRLLRRGCRPEIYSRRYVGHGIIAKDFTMADPVYSDDAYPIALLLKEAHPDADPAAMGLDELQNWVIRLEDFADDSDAVQREWLEQIQVEWVELRYG